MRYLASANPISVLSVNPKESHNKGVDQGGSATFSLPNDAIGSILCDFRLPPRFGIIPSMPRITAKVDCTEGSIELFNFVMPTLYHSITITKKKDGNTTTRKETAYTFKEEQGKDWWTTYRYQLEAFVDQLKGRTPQTWVDKEDTIANMECIEKVYEKVCHQALMGLVSYKFHVRRAALACVLVPILWRQFNKPAMLCSNGI
jgi:predicted dehydrogenase